MSIMERDVDGYTDDGYGVSTASGIRLIPQNAVVLEVTCRQRLVSRTTVRRHSGSFIGSEFAWTSTPVAHTDIQSVDERDVWVQYANGQELKADIPAELDLRRGQALEILYAVSSRGSGMSAVVVGVLNRSSMRYVVYSQNCELVTLGRRGVVNWSQVWSDSSWQQAAGAVVSGAATAVLAWIGFAMADYGIPHLVFPTASPEWLAGVAIAGAGLVGFGRWVLAKRKVRQARELRAFIEQIRQRYA